MSILEWAKNEVALATNPDSESVRDAHDIVCYKSALDALTAWLKYDHYKASMDFTLSILTRLARVQPLTPITEDDFTASDVVDDIAEELWMKELQMKSICFSPRFPSLYRIEYLDGRIAYLDTERVLVVNAHDQQQETSGIVIVLATKIIDELFPITLPYLPPLQKYIVTMERSTFDAGNSEVDTYAFSSIKTPEGETFDIRRYYERNENAGRWVEITRREYVSRKRCKPELEEAAHHAAKDYIKEYCDGEDIMPGEIELIRKKPTEHGWLWLFDTPRCYLEVCYNSEKSLFRVLAFEYDHIWEVTTEELLHSASE